MDITFFEIKKLTTQRIHAINNKFCRSIYIETKDGEKLEIHLFSEEVNDLIIKKEK